MTFRTFDFRSFSFEAVNMLEDAMLAKGMTALNESMCKSE